MPLKVEFQFDFGSPNAYLAEVAIPGIERRTGVKFDYVPVLLGGIYKATGNMSPFDSLRGIKNKPEYQALETQRSQLKQDLEEFRTASADEWREGRSALNAALEDLEKAFQRTKATFE